MSAGLALSTLSPWATSAAPAAGGAGGAGFLALASNPATIGLTVGMAGLALWDAMEKQKQAKAAMNAAAMNASGQLSSLGANLQLKLFENANRRAQVLGRTTTTLSALGGLGGSTSKNLLHEAVANAALADYYTRMDNASQQAQVRNQYASTVAGIRSSTPIPAVAAASGAFQGFSQGLALQGAMMNLNQSQAMAANPGRYA